MGAACTRSPHASTTRPSCRLIFESIHFQSTDNPRLNIDHRPPQFIHTAPPSLQSLVYSSRSRFSLHGLPVAVGRKSKPLPAAVADAAGDLKRKRTADASLVVVRLSPSIGGTETYLPPRLLQGVVPGALLEAFEAWQGEDGILRARPHDPSSQWFAYQLEVVVQGQGQGQGHAMVRRRPLDRAFTQVGACTHTRALGIRRIRGWQPGMLSSDALLMMLTLLILPPGGCAQG